MPDKKLFEAVNKNVNKFETRLENYVVPSLQSNKLNKICDDDVNKTDEYKKNKFLQTADRDIINEKSEERTIRVRNKIIGEYPVFADKQISEPPKLCMWFYMSEEDIINLLNTNNKHHIRKIIDNKMESEYPKGIARLLAVELIYSVTRFCQKCKFNFAQSGTLLSIFYLTHRYFISSFYTSAESTYNFFKEYMLLHCFECPPDSVKLFNYKECTHTAQYFCSLYLRNLPLVRLLALPNFGFYLNYDIPPEPILEEKKGKKGTKEKKEKKTKIK